MTAHAYLGLALTFFAVSATPGPDILALVSRTIGEGRSTAIALALGIVSADLVFLGVAIAGLAALAQSFSFIFTAFKWAGAGYLSWLAIRLWRASADEQPAAASRSGGAGRTFALGAAMTFGNPKVMMFYAALLPQFVDFPNAASAELLGVGILIAGVLVLVLGSYIMAADLARGHLAEPRRRRVANRVASGVMAGTAGLLVIR